MPPKKRSSLGRSTSASRRMAVSRTTETSEETRSRLDGQRTRQAVSRTTETSEERRSRLDGQRTRQAASRTIEAPEQSQARRNDDRARHSESRTAETPEQRQARRDGDRTKHSESRTAETPDQRQARRDGDRTRHSESRAAETMEEGQARRESDRSRRTVSRAAETAERGQARRDSDRSRRSLSRAAQWKFMEREAFQYDPAKNYDNHPQLCIGLMSQLCSHCNALKWSGEAPGMCCSNGKVKLPPLRPPPEPLEGLMSGNTPTSKHFLAYMRKYNSCFQMTSFGVDKKVCESGFMPTFKVQGQVYHRIGSSLLPTTNEEPKFLQIYFMGDEEQQAKQRCNYIPGVEKEIVLGLQRMFHQFNSYVHSFKSVLDKMPPDEYRVKINADKTPAGEHARRFNEPLTDEVAAVTVGEEIGTRDIVLEAKTNGKLQRVAETHRSYDALQYPLIFWEGEDGYNFLVMQTNPLTGMPIQGKKVSAMDFYAYRIMVRSGAANHILRCRQLFHQFIVDMYAKIEGERLSFLWFNQPKLRVEEYIHLKDAIINDGNADNLGRSVILPSTFTGSPRHMHEYTQDAMTYVRNYGRPDLFITFTCNPKWEEIKQGLLDGQTYSDRHDLLARVFRLKLRKMMDIITKTHIFGAVRCWMYSVEWQKRGLPHAHILIWFKDKIKSDQIDGIISAEIPDPDQDPRLFQIIRRNMIHGPCGSINRNSPCMQDNKCTKRYPRQLIRETETGDDGYPLYRRRSPDDGGFKAKITVKIGNVPQEIEVDNKWVVPYCPLLSRIFDAHINVEYCNSVKSIKYICKYVNKGSDQAVFGIAKDGTPVDEIKEYQLGRYISSNEAVWRILDFPIHERHPTVVHLAVHLENGQRVYFTEDNVYERVNEPPRTTLTAFFLLCQKDDFAKTLLYCDVPKYYTWDASKKVFKRRVQGDVVLTYPGVRSTDALGRVYTVHPNNAECFYLRLLLHTVTGPVSYEDLRTVNGRHCNTFREACQQLNLLADDAQWNATMAEAAPVKSAASLRILFVIILTMCAPSNPSKLWESYKESLSEDILLQARRRNLGINVNYTPDIFNQTLIILEDKALEMNGKDLKEYGLPTPDRSHADRLSRAILRETSYDLNELREYVLKNEPLLTLHQRAVYQAILDRIDRKTGGIIFLDAPGGTGKTFLINLLLAKIRQQSKIAIAVASSGIAATLLHGGRTAHSGLKLPRNLTQLEAPFCSISKGTAEAKVLQECELIVWDECTMSHKKALEALNRTLQDLRDEGRIMGGATLLLAGDFRQTLPVIPKGTMADELKACLKSSSLWRHVQTHKLKTNMRVHLHGDRAAGEFAEQLLNIGDGKIPADPISGLISIPKDFCNMVNSLEALQNNVFPDIQRCYTDHKWLCERAILAPKNDNVNAINLQIQGQLPGDIISYKSVDTLTDIDQAVQYPTEFLNSLELPGLPPHHLMLKVGSSIMLLRNLDAPRLCNGTRLCVKNLMPHVIEATVLTGCAKGEDVFIPRIPLNPSDTLFDFKRLQFPVRLAFAMSINKAQGQSLKVAGVHLGTSCFSHGQLYVACSRVGTGKNLYVIAPDGKTRNIVYQKALQ